MLQQKITKELAKHLSQEKFSECLSRRISTRVHLEEPPTNEQIKKFCSNIAGVANVLPQFVVVSFVRSLYNAWNTDARYNKVAACRWCGITA